MVRTIDSLFQAKHRTWRTLYAGPDLHGFPIHRSGWKRSRLRYPGRRDGSDSPSPFPWTESWKEAFGKPLFAFREIHAWLSWLWSRKPSFHYSIIPIGAKPLTWCKSAVSLPRTVFKQIQSVYSFICFPNTVVCFCCFWCSLLSDLRFSEGAFSSLLTDPNSFEISSLTYVWTS